MNYDFKNVPPKISPLAEALRKNKGLVLIAALAGFGLGILMPDGFTSKKNEATPQVQQVARLPQTSTVPAKAAAPAKAEVTPPAKTESASPVAASTPLTDAPEISAPVFEPELKEKAGVIQAGETISNLLDPWFSPAQILQLNQQSKQVFPLNQLCAGRPYRLCTLDGKFDSFAYDIDNEEQLIIRRNKDGFEIERVDIPYEVKVDTVKGTIQSSLFGAMNSAEEGPELTMRMADIFAWDIDFIRDLRTGDHFKLLVEKRFREGRFHSYGKILAAEFVNQGQTYRAVYFKDGTKTADYYDPQGQSMRKAFLKAPLKFSRISSGFTYRRKHPITGNYKPHLAIDYAAPRGTPVKAIGDGRVILRGYDKYSGNKVKIRHPNGYVSVYIHLQKFARGISKGIKVRQGQTIAYVGSTGLSTGPHLDFRMIKHGKPVNPLKVKSPAASPVSKKYRAQFNLLAQNMLARLETPAPAGSGQIHKVEAPADEQGTGG